MKTTGYFKLHYDPDDAGNVVGSAWIVPSRYGSAPGRPVELSHDCGSAAELNNVIDQMIANLVS